MTDAVRLTARLHNRILLGPILADRYLGRFHRSSPAELTAWLGQFGSQADAPAIRALLLKRLPARRPLSPSVRAVLAEPPPARLGMTARNGGAIDRLCGADPAADSHGAPLWLRNLMLDDGARDAVTLAERRLDAARYLQPAAAAVLRASLARALFAANHDRQALRIAAAAQRRAGPRFAGPPAFVAGLAAWRLGRLDLAATAFAATAQAGSASLALRAAGAFWAGRVAERRLHPGAAARWFRLAARSGQSFYGQIARDALGWTEDARHPVLTPADLDAISALPAGQLVFALIEIGQTARAAAALRVLWGEIGADPQLRQALMLIADRAGLRAEAGAMRARLLAARGVPPRELRFPLPVLRPRGGFRIDPALVYGVTRAESNFNAAAVSRAGARGLMQITPGTARAVTGDPHLTLASLHDPGFNLELGQRLVRELARKQARRGDLIGMLASYNAGLNNFRSWRGNVRDNSDALLFIEAIPVRQTRIFVERALAYTWLYAARMNEPAPSLDAIAEARFPRLDSHAPVLTRLH